MYCVFDKELSHDVVDVLDWPTTLYSSWIDRQANLDKAPSLSFQTASCYSFHTMQLATLSSHHRLSHVALCFKNAMCHARIMQSRLSMIEQVNGVAAIAGPLFRSSRLYPDSCSYYSIPS